LTTVFWKIRIRGMNDSQAVDVRPSPIEGLGVFARRRFRAGDRIRRITVVREVTPKAPFKAAGTVPRLRIMTPVAG
jgi:hypothetical protein